MQSLYDVGLAGEWMAPSGRLSAGHLALDGLEAVQHLCLQPLEGTVQQLTAHAVHIVTYLNNYRTALVISNH